MIHVIGVVEDRFLRLFYFSKSRRDFWFYVATAFVFVCGDYYANHHFLPFWGRLLVTCVLAGLIYLFVTELATLSSFRGLGRTKGEVFADLVVVTLKMSLIWIGLLVLILLFYKVKSMRDFHHAVREFPFRPVGFFITMIYFSALASALAFKEPPMFKDLTNTIQKNVGPILVTMFAFNFLDWLSLLLIHGLQNMGPQYHGIPIFLSIGTKAVGCAIAPMVIVLLAEFFSKNRALETSAPSDQKLTS